MYEIRLQIDRALEAFLALVQDRPALRAEFEGSMRDFFRGPPPAGDPLALLRHARRHVEWFLLERHSPSLRNTPVEVLHTEWSERNPELAAAGHALLASFAGMFEVLSVTPGQGLLLADLAGLTGLAAAEPEAANAAEVGDLIAGRLFPIGGDLHVVSSAAGYWRDPRLVAALRRDLEQLRDSRQNKVLHVSQLELESLFFGAGEIVLGSDPVGDARAFLEESGLGTARIDAIFERLMRAPYDPTRWAHGAQDTLGEILDELAFDTELDLEKARLRLLGAWAALAPEPDEPMDAGPRAPDPRAAIAAFDEARRSGASLEEIFQRLERDLGLDAIGGDEEDGDSPLPDFPGVVGAIVQEFVWETSLTDPAAAGRWRILEKLGRFAAPIGLLEELDSPALLRFATFWVLEYDELPDERAATELVEALSAFATWAEQVHELDLGAAHEPLATLGESLPRVWRANRARVPASDGDLGLLHEIVALEPSGQAELRDPDGTLHGARLPASIARCLAAGDRLRVRFDARDGAVTVLCCYPPEIATLASL